MKRLLSVIALGAIGASSAFAQSGVTIYGRVNTSVESQKDLAADGRQTVMQNNSSRWGLMGSEDLGGGLKASFLLESGFDSDTGRSTQTGAMFGRESWVALEGSFGRVRLGNMGSTALYYATADYISMHNHDTGTSADAFYLYPGRTTNVVAYNTPSFGGLVAEIQLGLKETRAAGNSDTMVLALNYDAGPLHLGGGYLTDKIDGIKSTEFGVRGLYELGALTVGAYFAHNEFEFEEADLELKRDTYRVSAMYTVGAQEFHVNVGVAGKFKGNGSTADGTDATQYTVGYNYNLSKRTKAYAFYSAVKNKDSAEYLTFAPGNDPSILAVGLRHNF